MSKYNPSQDVVRRDQARSMRDNETFLGSLWLYNYPKESVGIISPYEWVANSKQTRVRIAQWIMPGLMENEVDYKQGFDAFLEEGAPGTLFQTFTSMVMSGHLDLLSPSNQTQLQSILDSATASSSRHQP